MLLFIDTDTCRVGDRSPQLFLYCCVGESSVKCVHPALEMEASEEEQRGVVRLLVAEGAATRHKAKKPWNASDGIILLHVNARRHTANLVRDKLQIFGWETLQHPPYIPDISPCYFHIFDDPKKGIHERRFHSDNWISKCKSG